jgi:hypothetical protein
MRETTALGAAIAAGFAVGVWQEFDELKGINQKDRMIFEPNISKEDGEKMFKKWGRVSFSASKLQILPKTNAFSRLLRCVAVGWTQMRQTESSVINLYNSVL